MYVSTRWFRLARHDEPDPTPGAPEPTEPVTPPEPSQVDDKKPEPKPKPAPTEDVNALPDWAQKLIRDARGDAAKARTTAKQTAADEARQELAKQVAKALGIQQDDEPVDPAVLTEQIEQAQAHAWKSTVELQVHRLAAKLGGDPEKLLDSMAFIDSLDDLVDTDPASADFKAALESKVSAAVERNPAYKTAAAAPVTPLAPRPDASQGRGGDTKPPDFRTADHAAFQAELAKYGLRPRTHS